MNRTIFVVGVTTFIAAGVSACSADGGGSTGGSDAVEAQSLEASSLEASSREAECDAISIAAARRLPAGTRVTVEGFVTVAPGTFASATGEEGFAIQDHSAGIYVTLPQKLGFGLHDHLRVTGTIDAMAKLLVIASTPSSVRRIHGSRTIAPRHVATGAIAPATEGLLVSAKGKVTKTFQDDSPYGYKLYFDDGSGEVQIFVHVSTGVDPATLKRIEEGQTLRVTGFVSRFEDTFELAPRRSADIVVR